MSNTPKIIMDYRLFILGVAAGCVSAFCIVLGVDWLIYVAPVCLLPPLLILLVVKRIMGKRREEQYQRFFVRMKFPWIFTFLLGVIASENLVALTAAVLSSLPGKYLNWLALAVLPIGYGAHYFKKLNQLVYGTVEILVGAATALGSTARPEFHSAQGLTIIGAIYIVARGFNNISEARSKQKTSADKTGLSSLPQPS
jgi:hypothetical protein